MKTRNDIPQLRNTTARQRLAIWRQARQESPRFRTIYRVWTFLVFVGCIAAVRIYRDALPDAVAFLPSALAFATAFLVGAGALYFFVYPELDKALNP